MERIHRIRHIARQLHPLRITESLHIFLRDESIGGKLVIGAALLSLLVVNSPLSQQFADFWHHTLSLNIAGWSLSLTFHQWLNEGLMALFFLVVGLEIKREFVRGELREKRTALLPIGAAIGGVVVPALLYLAFTFNTPAAHGWGIPISTDTAIAIAVLGMLRNHIPIQLKIFLLALAVADDVLAVTVIAFFYSGNIDWAYLSLSVAIIGLIYLFRGYLASRLLLVLALGIVLWLTTYESGIHASVVGVIMGLLAPIPPKGVESTPEKVERFFLPITTLFVVPIFAFANAGVVFTAEAFTQDSYIIAGIMAGLIIGKVIGIAGASFLLVAIKQADLPDNVTWRHIVGVSLIAGIGFTMSIFIAELTFGYGSPFIDTAKIGIFVASIISGVLGVAILRTAKRSHTVEQQ